MNGDIMDMDDVLGQRKVGYFNMIDTTDERMANSMMEDEDNETRRGGYCQG